MPYLTSYCGISWFCFCCVFGVVTLLIISDDGAVWPPQFQGRAAQGRHPLALRGQVNNTPPPLPSIDNPFVLATHVHMFTGYSIPNVEYVNMAARVISKTSFESVLE